mgnify:CR=1 FL=1
MLTATLGTVVPVCLGGTYATENTCLPCPFGGVCPVGVLPYPAPGFMQVNDDPYEFELVPTQANLVGLHWVP